MIVVMLPQKDPRLNAVRAELEKARIHLGYSFAKSKNFNFEKDAFSEQELETLESFSSRFARYSDMLIKKYFRLLALLNDPGYSGTVIDLLNLAEKQHWIESAKQWQRIRELRNFAAHEYAVEAVRAVYTEFLALTPVLLAVDLGHEK